MEFEEPAIKPRAGYERSYAVEDAYKKMKAGEPLSTEEENLLRAAKIKDVPNDSLERAFGGVNEEIDSLTRKNNTNLMQPGEKKKTPKGLEIQRPPNDNLTPEEIDSLLKKGFITPETAALMNEMRTPASPDPVRQTFQDITGENSDVQIPLAPEVIQTNRGTSVNYKDVLNINTDIGGTKEAEKPVYEVTGGTGSPSSSEKSAPSQPRKKTASAASSESETERRYNEKVRILSEIASRNTGVPVNKLSPGVMNAVYDDAAAKIEKELNEARADANEEGIKTRIADEAELERIKTSLQRFDSIGVPPPRSYLERKDFLEQRLGPPPVDKQQSELAQSPVVDPNNYKQNLAATAPSTAGIQGMQNQYQNLPAQALISGMQMQNEGIARKAEAERLGYLAEEQKRLDTDKYMMAEQDRLRAKQQFREMRTTDMMNKLTEAADRLDQLKVDPNRWWNSRTTGQKMSAYVGLALSGFQGSQAVGMIQNAINADIGAQKFNIETQAKKVDAYGNILSYMRGIFNDENQAEQASVAWGWKRAENLLNAQLARTKSVTARENGRILQGQITMKFAEALTKAAASSIPFGVRGVYPKNKEEADLFVPTLGMFAPGGLESAKKIKEYEGEYAQISTLMDQAKAFRKKYGWSLDILPEGTRDQGQRILRALQIRLKGPGFANLGVLTGPDLQILEDMTGTNLASMGYVLKGLQTLEEIINRSRSGFLRSQGVMAPPSRFNPKAR